MIVKPKPPRFKALLPYYVKLCVIIPPSGGSHTQEVRL